MDAWVVSAAALVAGGTGRGAAPRSARVGREEGDIRPLVGSDRAAGRISFELMLGRVEHVLHRALGGAEVVHAVVPRQPRERDVLVAVEGDVLIQVERKRSFARCLPFSRRMQALLSGRDYVRLTASVQDPYDTSPQPSRLSPRDLLAPRALSLRGSLDLARPVCHRG